MTERKRRNVQKVGLESACKGAIVVGQRWTSKQSVIQSAGKRKREDFELKSRVDYRRYGHLGKGGVHRDVNWRILPTRHSHHWESLMQTRECVSCRWVLPVPRVCSAWFAAAACSDWLCPGRRDRIAETQRETTVNRVASQTKCKRLPWTHQGCTYGTCIAIGRQNFPESQSRQSICLQEIEGHQLVRRVFRCCWPSRGHLPATRMCCRRVISSQSKQHSVSPVRKRVFRVSRCWLILLNRFIKLVLLAELGSFFASISLNFCKITHLKRYTIQNSRIHNR